MLFIAEDTTGQKFGGYVDAKVDHYATLNHGLELNKLMCISDPKSFLFNLKSNGRLQGMMKFNISDPSRAIRVFTQSDKEGDMFELGWGDFRVFKKHKTSSCYCANGGCYNYQGVSYGMCGQHHFTVKRVIAIQLK